MKGLACAQYNHPEIGSSVATLSRSGITPDPCFQNKNSTTLREFGSIFYKSTGATSKGA